MRYNNLFGKTLKENPKEATITGHRLLIRGGFIYQVSAGIYSLLPLGWRVFKKIDQIIREEFAKRGVQDLLMPVFHPASLWEETGRINTFDVLASFESKRSGTMVIAPTHEETVSQLARSFIQSYKDLPVIVNQNQLKFRDEVRVQGGILRTREFWMQDAYSFDKDVEGMGKSYEIMKEAYKAVFARIGLSVLDVHADSGSMGGSGSEEFIVLSDIGEDRIAVCSDCAYRANLEKADSIVTQVDRDPEQKPMEDVKGVGLIGVEPLAEFLKIPVEQTTKTLLYEVQYHDNSPCKGETGASPPGEHQRGLVAAAVRGDYNINETKLRNILGAKKLELATAEVVKQVTGAEIGYAGLLNLPESVTVIADYSMQNRTNFEMGANKTNYHSINVNFERDFPMPEFADIKDVKEGDICSNCEKGKVIIKNGIEVGHIFQLGQRYSKDMQITFADEDGKEKNCEMGCYGIGMTRVIGAAVEQRHDENGIIWPKNIAPFQVHIVTLGKEEEVHKAADDLYNSLISNNIEVLYDNRDVSAGIKFADADLIGIPVRITVGKKSLAAGGIELKLRPESDSKIIKQKELTKELSKILNT